MFRFIYIANTFYIYVCIHVDILLLDSNISDDVLLQEAENVEMTVLQLLNGEKNQDKQCNDGEQTREARQGEQDGESLRSKAKAKYQSHGMFAFLYPFFILSQFDKLDFIRSAKRSAPSINFK